MHPLSISLIVPVHEGQDRKIFESGLRSVLKMSPQPAEIILVSDGPDLSLPDFVGSSQITQMATNIRSGPAVARNLGAERATGDILCFLDSDIVVPNDLLARIDQRFQERPKIAALFGSYDADPLMPNFLSQYRNLLHHFVHQNSNEEAFTFWSGCGAVRREIFWGIGGFDGQQFPHPSIEDIELGYRLRKAGYSIALCKDIQVKHLKKWLPYPMLRVDFCHRALPWTRLLLQEKNIANDLNLKLSDRLSTVAVFLLLLSLLLVFWAPYALYVSIPAFLIFIGLNINLYVFFYKQKGWCFAVRVVPWHLIFYLISGTAFLLGAFQYYVLSKIK